MWETWVWSLGWASPLEKGKATHSSKLTVSGASLIAQLEKILPAVQETTIQFLGQEYLLEKGLATHSSILGLPLWLSWYRIPLQCQRPGFDPWVGKILWRRERLPTPVFWPGKFYKLYSPPVAKNWTRLSDFHFHFQVFPGGWDGKESAWNAGDPGSGRSPGEWNGNSLYSCLRNPMGIGAWWTTVRGVAMSQTWLSN